MVTNFPQRTYRAPCPGCGAPVEFRSAQSTHAICPYCQSTVLRNGETLSRTGKMAELFNDFSPLQLQASGTFEGRQFTLVGRLQYQYAQGTWTEWYAVFDDLEQGSIGFLGEDNGTYVFALPTSMGRELPPAESLRVGGTTAIEGKPFSVASNQSVSLLSAQGELPHLPPLGATFAMVELRSTDGEVLSIDYAAAATAGAPVLSRGRAVLLADLKLSGLKDESTKDEAGKHFNCPSCGSTVEVALATSKSITCSSCKSIIDLSQGIGAALRYAEQEEPVIPLIALGTVGNLRGADWQVVGFQHRMGKVLDQDEDDADESFVWNEYLLFNLGRGFIFLVDADDGWSLVKPTTGAPIFKPGEQTATYLNNSYSLLSSYEAETRYVAGEFYWQVKRGEKTFNRDFANGKAVLSQEQSGAEITWSSGRKINSKTIADAFKLAIDTESLERSDAAPLSSASEMGCGTIVFAIVLLLVIVFILTDCTQCDPRVENCSSSSGARTSGGSFGGFSGGGGHK